MAVLSRPLAASSRSTIAAVELIDWRVPVGKAPCGPCSSGLDPQHYVATGVMIAILIDLSRLPTYAASFGGTALGERHELGLIAVGTLCAFAGAWLGARYAKKATVAAVRNIVAALMLVIGAS